MGEAYNEGGAPAHTVFLPKVEALLAKNKKLSPATPETKIIKEMFDIMFPELPSSIGDEKWEITKKDESDFGTQPRRSYPKKKDDAPSANPRSKGVVKSSSGRSGGGAWDSTQLAWLGCFFAVMMIVKMFLRKCRRK